MRESECARQHRQEGGRRVFRVYPNDIKSSVGGEGCEFEGERGTMAMLTKGTPNHAYLIFGEDTPLPLA
jgi:hypothetical protein